MKNISIVCVVYNESTRIEKFIKSYIWSDDIIIIDKSSNDNTADIIKKYNCKYIKVKYSDTGDEAKYGIACAKNEWILLATASDYIQKNLVNQLKIFVNSKYQKNWDAVALPYKMYVLGICNKRSPWYGKHKIMFMRKSAIKTSTYVHEEVRCSSDKIFYMKALEDNYYIHLTHENLDTLYERHIRYTKLETNKYNDEDHGFNGSILGIIRAFYHVTIKRKTILIGWDGLALSLLYIEYYIMIYLRIWEKYRCNSKLKYASIIDNIIKDSESL